MLHVKFVTNFGNIITLELKHKMLENSSVTKLNLNFSTFMQSFHSMR